MVNINSFHSTDLNQNNPNSQNIIPNINYSSISSNEKNNIGKITNNNKNNNLNELLNLNGENIENYLEKEKNKDENKNNLNNEEKNEKNNSKEESAEEEDELDEENENDKAIITNDEINEIIQKLLNGQIQISNISSQKMVITELIKLSEKLKELLTKNQDLEIYHLAKDLIPILITFTYNKNNDILIKSSEILSFLNEKIINEIFFFPKRKRGFTRISK